MMSYLRVVEKADFLVVLVDTTGNDLFQNVRGLLGVLGIVAELLGENRFLLVNDLSRYVLGRDVLGVDRGDLHGNVLAELSELRLGSHLVGGVKSDHNADSAAAVYIGDNSAFVLLKAANLDVLADDQNLLFQERVNGHLGAGSRLRQKRLYVGGILFDHGLGAGVNECHEFGVLCHEVGLGVDFDHNAHVVLDQRVNGTLGSDSACLLLGSGQTLLAQNVNSLIHIAVGFGECLFAVHHAAAGHFSQIFNISSCKCHVKFLLHK